MPDCRDLPTVSIILPTYNRAKYLNQAFTSIKSQTYSDWELIVVDDGSTDDTRVIVHSIIADWPQSVRYHSQENQGAYGARNTGLDMAKGRYIAFFDSDDLWMPHHLEKCAAALDANLDVDWVYGSSRLVEQDSGRVVNANAFYESNCPKPFRVLKTEKRSSLHVFQDERLLECAILRGVYAGLQCSVIRRDVFRTYRFESKSRNEAEDRIAILKALACGRKLAYFDDVHLEYRIHSDNSSAAGVIYVDKQVRLYHAIIAGYERLRSEIPLTKAQSRALDQRLSGDYIWHLGHIIAKVPGREREAIELLGRGLRLHPWSWRKWRTFLATCVRSLRSISSNTRL